MKSKLKNFTICFFVFLLAIFQFNNCTPPKYEGICNTKSKLYYPFLFFYTQIANFTSYCGINSTKTKTPLSVISTTPIDGSFVSNTGIVLSVSFSKAMDTSTITVNSTSTVCSGNLQLSNDDFATCYKLSPQPSATNSNSTFTIVPDITNPILINIPSIKFRVTSLVKDSTGENLATQFTSLGFSTVFINRQYSFTSGSLLDQNSTNTLTAIASPVLANGKDGETSGSYYLNGTSQYFTGVSTNLPTGARSRSVCVWVMPSALPTNPGEIIGIINYGTVATDQSFGINFYNNAGTQQVLLSATNNVLALNHTVPLNVWSHLCAVYDGTTAEIFVNGTSRISAAKTYNTQNNFLGIGAVGTGNFYRGKIDEIIIYNTKLTAKEYRQIATQVPNGLIAYYDFSGDTNDVIGTNNGTITGSVTPAPDRYGNLNSAYQTISTDGNYIRAPDTGLPMGTSPRTMCMWIRTGGTTNFATPVHYGTSANTQAFGIDFQSGIIRSWGFTSDLSATFSGFSTTSFVWNHVCISYNGTQGQIYLNGRSIFGPTAQTLNTVSSGFLNIGSFVVGKADATTMDDVRVYNRVLSITEIQAISGNSYTQVTGWNSIIGSSNLQFFLNIESLSNQANSTGVSNWNDRSGNGFSLTQPTPARQPTYLTNGINGRPALQMRGDGDALPSFMSGACAPPLNSAANTIFSVLTETSQNINNGIFQNGGPAASTGGKLLYFVNSSPNRKPILFDLNANGPALSSTNPYNSLNESLILALDYNSSVGNLFKNGTSFATTPGGAGTYNCSTGTLDIGRYFFGGTYPADGGYFKGFMGDFLYFNAALSASDRQIVQCFLSTKYNIPVAGACP